MEDEETEKKEGSNEKPAGEHVYVDRGSSVQKAPPYPEELQSTPDDDAPEELAHGQGPDVIQPTDPPKEPKVEECDPMTMNCNDMPKTMAELTKRSEILRTGVKKLQEINEVIPSEEGKQLLIKTTDAKAKVDGKIEDIVLRFSKCRLSEEKEESTENPPQVD